MQPDSVELSFLSILAFITFFIFLIVSRYSYRNNNNALLDLEYSKPQAFHNEPISRSGGIASIISLLASLGVYYLLFSVVLYEYLFICSSLFMIGYLDDIKTKLSPNLRLVLMMIFLVIFIIILPIEIINIDLIFLNSWLENKVFSIFFILLCFLFIINGANLVDGFNGLLTINLIIINSVLLFVNLSNNHTEFSFFLSAQIIILISFLLFNFPKAKMFLGDSGSYLFGSLVALNVIITNNLNANISSFFLCILLFYLFFEVFFSFCRKIYQKKSPVFPDNEHLHMLSYLYIYEIFGPNKSNYMNSVLINSIYCFLVLPSIYFAENTLISKYWFFSLILVYTLCYFRLYRLTKKKIDI